MSSIDDLLGEAEFDSSGKFSLDFASSRKRWETIARADRTAFLRLFIQALMASGAGAIDIQADAKECHLNWGGCEWGRPELQHIFDYLSGKQDLFVSQGLQLAKLGAMLSSCRPDLRLHLGHCSGSLVVDNNGPRWDSGGQSGIRYERIAPRPADYKANPFKIDYLSPIVSTAWPEITDLRSRFCDLPCNLTLFGKAFGEESLTVNNDDIQGLVGEIARCAIIHPQRERNNVSMTFRQLPKPLCYLAPSHLICLSTEGRRVPVQPNTRLRCATAFVLHPEPLKSQGAGKEWLLRINKFGSPIADLSERGDVGLRLVADGSSLPTDIGCSKAVRGPELEALLLETRGHIQMALEVVQAEVASQPLWSRFLCLAYPQAVEASLRNVRDKLSLAQ